MHPRWKHIHMQLHIICSLSSWHDESSVWIFIERGQGRMGLQSGCKQDTQKLNGSWQTYRGMWSCWRRSFTRRATGMLPRLCRQEGTNVCEQGVEARPIWNITPAACRVVKSLVPALILQPIHSMITQEVNRGTNYWCSNPWSSISWRWHCHFQSRTHAPQLDFSLRNTSYIQYTIPPLCPTFIPDLVSSSLSFPTHLFSRLWDHDEGIATREGVLGVVTQGS